ncbi:diguanylate cyclase [Meiothermus sp. CFH 77666]|uniref:diguanylate cyclase domain-containing protein n=1 Tax=Meiothermus sp. CFH 77666 TaxID=2817942 RepID=UPI001FB160FB|nr:diguanylate cyclase [Meiothermus sp. CFH 77666]
MPSREQVLNTIPELLAQQEGLVTVWLPDQSGLRLHKATGQWKPDPFEQAAIYEAYRQGSSATSKETEIGRRRFSYRQKSYCNNLAIPLCERDEVVAILNLRRYRAFQPREQACFEHFARTISNRLSWIAEQAEIQLLNQLSASLASAHSIQGVVDRAMVLLVSALGMQQGVILQQLGSSLRPLGHYDATANQSMVGGLESILTENPLFWEVHRSGRPIFINDLTQEASSIGSMAGRIGSLVIHPIALPDTPRTRVMLCLAHSEPRWWRQSEQELLALACRSVGLALEGAIARKRLEKVLELSGQAALSNSENLYQQVLDAAVELIPGAEAGSLLVRKGERFYFEATVGYDLESLRGITFREEEHLVWYGGDLEGWQKGEARILSNEWTSIRNESVKSSSSEPTLRAYTERIQSNLAIPILYQGNVLALLNLDNFHGVHAFGKDSLEAARFFVTPVATLLHEAHTRQCLKEAAMTDSLTGLANRRAFNSYFDEELIRSKRYHQPFTLLLLDLQGFKTINDRLGHAFGDEALVRVAHALQQESRESDGLFRLGGDEFAALLPHTPAEQAIHVAKRYVNAIQAISLQGLGLSANIGLAAYPEDGTEKEALMHIADEWMYAAKEQAVGLVHG